MDDERGGEDARLRLAVDTAVQLVEGCDHASIAVALDDRIVTRAASQPVAERADTLQQEIGEGPCSDAIRSRGTVVSQDLARDERWPRWSAEAAPQLGVACTASIWIPADGLNGSLNLYGLRRHGLVDAGLATAQTLVERLGVAIAVGRDADELNAVGSRTVLGQAQGILMERLGVDATVALGHLRDAAGRSGLELPQVAVELVRTRQLPAERSG